MSRSTELLLGRRKYRPTAKDVIGEGGEATIYDVSGIYGAKKALKLWKPFDHPDYAGNDEQAKRNREAAKDRLKIYAEKLPVLPKGLGPLIILPEEMALEATSRGVTGYVMDYLWDYLLLAKYATKDFRDTRNIGPDQIVEIFRNLHQAFHLCHKLGVVWGDVNFNNIMVKDKLARLIDVDSVQYGKFVCRSFTPRFTDPLLCDPKETRPVMIRPPTSESDWYSYALMLFECLLFTSPYGGVYVPKNKKALIKHDQRPLKRISVFNSEVTYPKRAVPLDWLPKQASEYFEALLKDDVRGEFPLGILDLLEAKSTGKFIDPATLASRASVTETIRGKASLRRVFETAGLILAAAVQSGKLNYLYHSNESYLREDGSIVIPGPLDPDCKFRLNGRRTLIAKDNKLHLIEGGEVKDSQTVDTYRSGRPVFDGNANHYFWLQSGKLYRDDAVGNVPRSKILGSCLENQSLFWVGPRFGVGFYRAEGVQVGFTFSSEKGGISDSVTWPAFKGRLNDAICHFSDDFAWLLVSVQDQGVSKNLCLLLNESGQVLAKAEGKEGDGSWLECITGKAAFAVKRGDTTSGALFAATDKGLIALIARQGSIEVGATYPDTEDFVHPEDRLFYVPKEGLYVVSRREVHLLRLH